MIVVVFGTRPDAIKLGPVVASLKAQKIPHRILCTNQHTDLLRGTPAETDLRDSESLGLSAKGDPIEWVGEATSELVRTLAGRPPALVVVQGDTASALAGASAASALGIPIAHVEAGIRSHDVENPWPEELFRKEITQLSTWHFAPTLTAYDNLIAEGIAPENIYLTGNPIVSAIARYSDVAPVPSPDIHILFTMHRREWLRGAIHGVLDGLQESATRYPDTTIFWPVHPGVAPRLPSMWKSSLPSNLHLIAPLGYQKALQLLARSLGVITDSGGLCEEAATLGVPCAVMRHVTDRPESLAAEIARLYPPTTSSTLDAFTAIHERHILRHPTSLYGTPTSAEKIAITLGTLTSGFPHKPPIPFFMAQ